MGADEQEYGEPVSAETDDARSPDDLDGVVMTTGVAHVRRDTGRG
jgi:hypothetical protein